MVPREMRDLQRTLGEKAYDEGGREGERDGEEKEGRDEDDEDDEEEDGEEDCACVRGWTVEGDAVGALARRNVIILRW